MAHKLSPLATPPRHWLDALIAGVVEHNGEGLTAHQLVNAVMHAPPIVNAIQGPPTCGRRMASSRPASRPNSHGKSAWRSSASLNATTCPKAKSPALNRLNLTTDSARPLG